MKVPYSTCVLCGAIICFITGCVTGRNSTRTITFNLKTKNINYSQVPDGYIKAYNPFNISILENNPFAFNVDVSTTSTTIYIDNNNAVQSYVTLNANTGKTTTDDTGDASNQLKSNAKLDTTIIRQLKLMSSEITKTENLLIKDIENLSHFYNALVNMQSNVNEWKNQQFIDKAIVDSQLSETIKLMGTSIDQFYSDNRALVNPYIGALGDRISGYRITNTMVTEFPALVIAEYRSILTRYQEQLLLIEDFGRDNKINLSPYYVELGIVGQTYYKMNKQDRLKSFQRFTDEYEEHINKNLLPLCTNFSLVKNAKYEQTFGPFELRNEDEMTIKIAQINIINKHDELMAYPGITLMRQGFKIDFSAGLFASGLHDRAYVSSQSTRITMDSIVTDGVVGVIPTQTTYSKILERKSDKFSYGPMAFIHFYSRNSRDINFGAYIGTGFLFKNDAKPVISFGGSMLFGKYQRLILGLGAGISSVTRLSSRYTVNQSYAENITDVPTENQTKVKWLFSVSWNISR